MKMIKADFFREKEWTARKMITGSGVRMNSETPEQTKAILDLLQDWYNDYKGTAFEADTGRIGAAPNDFIYE